MGKKAVFAQTESGKKFVRLEAVMHPLVAACDGVPMYFLGRKKVPHMEINDAIEWCRKESEYSPKHVQILKHLEKFRDEKDQTEEVHETEH